MFFHGYVNVLLSSFVLKFNAILLCGIALTTVAAIALWLFDVKRKKTVRDRPSDGE